MLRTFLLALGVLIIYGSLFPFDFSDPGSLGSALVSLVLDWQLFTSRGDVLGNVGLFLPVGLLAIIASNQSTRPARALAGYLLGAFLVALACQIGQLYVPSRHAAMGDVVWNMLGTICGMVAGTLAERYLTAIGNAKQLVFPAGLVALWLIAELAPLVPTLSLSSLRENASRLLIPTFSWTDALLAASGLFAAATLIEPVLESARARWAMLLLMIIVVVGKILVVSAGLEVATVTGLLAGYWSFALVSRRARSELLTVAFVLLFITITVRGLEPFVLRDDPTPWQWLPFASWLQGSMLSNLKSLAVSVFLYGATLGLVAVNRRHVLTSSITLAIWVALLEVAQMWIEGRSADPSEALLVLLIGIGIRALRPLASYGYNAGSHWPSSAPAPAYAPRQISPRRGLIELVVVCILIAIGMGIVLRMPGMPYNVLELFLDRGSFLPRLAFAFAILWIGGGAALAAGFVRNSRLPLLAWLWTTLAVSTVSLILLSISVTQESIGDIAGSTNLYWFVTNRDTWGTWWRELFLWLGSPALIAFFERPVRFTALYGPLTMFLGVMWLAATALQHGTTPWKRIALTAACALPWLWLCKAIAFDWSSTDNLNELIARDGPWGWGGGGYLYALLGLISANSVLLVCRPATRHHVARAALTTALAVPVGWWLIGSGLESHVQKYGQVFSGVQFLLGPDRAHHLSLATLFGRWAAVQLGLTSMLAAGLRFGLVWAHQRDYALESSRGRSRPSARQKVADVFQQRSKVIGAQQVIAHGRIKEVE